MIVRSREELERNELAVFREFVRKVDSMMIAHISLSGLEAGDLPASLSPTLIRGLLREEMGFDGLVMTDDLDMGAILNHYGFEETIRKGIAAGNDLLMICHRIELAAQAENLAGKPSRRRRRVRARGSFKIQSAAYSSRRVQRGGIPNARHRGLGPARAHFGGRGGCRAKSR